MASRHCALRRRGAGHETRVLPGRAQDHIARHTGRRAQQKGAGSYRTAHRPPRSAAGRGITSHGTQAAAFSRRAQDHIARHTGRRVQQKGAGSHRVPAPSNCSSGRRVLSRGKTSSWSPNCYSVPAPSNGSSGRRVLSRGNTRTWSLNRYSVPTPLEQQFESLVPTPRGGWYLVAESLFGTYTPRIPRSRGEHLFSTHCCNRAGTSTAGVTQNP